MFYTNPIVAYMKIKFRTIPLMLSSFRANCRVWGHNAVIWINFITWLNSIKFIQYYTLRALRFQRPLLIWKFTYENKHDIFAEDTDSSCYIVVWSIYASCTYNLMPKHTNLQYSIVCISVIFELLPLHPSGILGEFRPKWYHQHILQFTDYNVWKGY